MNENTPKPVAAEYEFGGLRFSPNTSTVICLKTGAEISLRRTLSEFLLLLLTKARETVEYQEFRDGIAAWMIYKDVAQLTRTIHVTKGELIKNLRRLREDFDLIEAVPAKGYRLSADVSELFLADADLPPANAENRSIPAKEAVRNGQNSLAGRFFGGHLRQAIFACAIYAALFVVALFIEVAYEFDSYKNLAFSLAMPVFLWIWSTSLFALFLSRRKSENFVTVNFILPIVIFIFSAILLHVFLGAFIPAAAITRANFQTYPASAAYLKDIFYFLTLGIFLIALPFSAIVRLESEFAESRESKLFSHSQQTRQRKTSLARIFIFSAKLLLGLTITAVLVSLWATAHLLDNLKPDPHHNFFVQMVLCRWFLYFGLAAECLIWYWIKIRTLTARRL